MKRIFLFTAILTLLVFSVACNTGNVTSELPDSPTASTVTPAVTESLTPQISETAAPTLSVPYTADTSLGEGGKTITVEVLHSSGKTVVFTIKTDAETLGQALVENSLVTGDESAYGLYIKSVNGETAEYTDGGHFWCFYKDGTMMSVGADSQNIEDGEHYEIKYT